MITTEKIQYRRMPELADRHDELWLCVRSIQPKSKKTLMCVSNIEWHPELSPSTSLFFDYRDADRDGRWNQAYYDGNYAPRFLREMTSPDAKRSLRELILRGSEGNDIAIACFCSDIELCHRKVLLGMLQGATEEMGLSHVVDRKLPDWSRYWNAYKTIAGRPQAQMADPVMEVLDMTNDMNARLSTKGRPDPMTVPGDVSLARDCVIVHQVNCQDAIGAGVSGSLTRRWPVVAQKYHAMAQRYPDPQSRLGLVLPTKVEDDTIVCNLFSQLHYGNSAKTGIVYTDTDKLVDGIRRVCERYPDKTVCVPERIGCGLAGADWHDVKGRLSSLPVCVVAYEPGRVPDLPTRAQLDDHVAQGARVMPTWQGATRPDNDPSQATYEP